MNEFDISVWCDVSIGGYNTGINKKKKPINKKNRVYWDKNEEKNEISLPQIIQHFPKDITQVPDIFIDLFT